MSDIRTIGVGTNPACGETTSGLMGQRVLLSEGSDRPGQSAQVAVVGKRGAIVMLSGQQGSVHRTCSLFHLPPGLLLRVLPTLLLLPLRALRTLLKSSHCYLLPICPRHL